MKTSVFLITALAFLCICDSSLAEDDPALPGLWGISPGIYGTFYGTLLPGRMTESWVSDSLDFYVPGNVASISSWDGDSLGSQWRVWDATTDSDGGIMTSYVINETGTGYIDYEANYDGGWIWFNKDHFGDGTLELGGWITYMNSASRNNYVNGTLVGTASNVVIHGRFNYCPGCVFQVSIGNAINIWNPGSTDPLPEGYPALSENALTGCLRDVCCVLVEIYCQTDWTGNPYCIQIGTETSSWGKIKKLHR